MKRTRVLVLLFVLLLIPTIIVACDELNPAAAPVVSDADATRIVEINEAVELGTPTYLLCETAVEGNIEFLSMSCERFVGEPPPPDATPTSDEYPAPTVPTTATTEATATVAGTATATIRSRTPTPTAGLPTTEPTGIPSPTAVTTPGATNTPGPTATTPPEGDIEPFADAPLCPDSGEDHDKSVFHTLWDSVRGCHYDHAHGQTLQQWAVDLFGDIAQRIGRTISYPWQTARENELKHQGYIVQQQDVRQYDCRPSLNNDGGVDAYIFQIHGVGISHGKLARNHSFFAAVNLCHVDHGYAGQMITGGHADFGQLISPYKEPGSFVSYPRFPEQLYGVDPPPYVGEAQNVDQNRNHVETWNSAYRKNTSPHVDEHQLMGFAFTIHSPVDFVDPATRLTGNPVFVPFSFPGHDSSSYFLYQVEVVVPFELAGPDGLVNFQGFTDVRGNISATCQYESEVCVPLVFVDAIPGEYTVNLTASFREELGIQPGSPEHHLDHDVCFLGDSAAPCLEQGAVSSGWIDLSTFGVEPGHESIN